MHRFLITLTTILAVSAPPAFAQDREPETGPDAGAAVGAAIVGGILGGALAAAVGGRHGSGAARVLDHVPGSAGKGGPGKGGGGKGGAGKGGGAAQHHRKHGG